MNRLIVYRLLIGLAAIQLCTAAVRADAATEKLAPPDADTRAREMKVVDEIYKDPIAKAHTSAEKAALASDIIRSAADAKEKAAEQYALYSKAAEIAVQAGDVTTAFAAVDLLSRRFQIDSLAMEADTLAKLAVALKQTSEQKAFVEHCAAAIDDAVMQERYDLVKRVSDLDVLVARKYGDAASLKSATLRLAETHPARIAFDKQKAASAALRRNPADADANFTAGSYQCFIKDDWKDGLPLLARCNDAVLKSLAEQDLAGGSDAQAKMTLADGWWDRAAKERGLAQRHVLHRAVVLYNDLLPSLTGLTKSKAEKRAATLAGVPGFSAGGMTLGEVLTRFTFPNKTFHINEDAITGHAEDYDNPATYTWLENAETMQSFEYGLAIKAKWYQAAVVEIDGRRYRFTHGFQGVNDSMIDVSGIRGVHYPVTVKDPNAWATIKAVVAQNKVTFYYNGTMVGSCDLQTPTSPNSKVRVGFGSHGTEISVKDIYLVEK